MYQKQYLARLTTMYLKDCGYGQKEDIQTKARNGLRINTGIKKTKETGFLKPVTHCTKWPAPKSQDISKSKANTTFSMVRKNIGVKEG